MNHKGLLTVKSDIYNALTIHGICEQGVPTSVLGVKSFWKSTAYNIGGHIFTLDDIEHGILRGLFKTVRNCVENVSWDRSQIYKF